MALEFAKMISHWTKELTLFTNGPSALSPQQETVLVEHHIPIVEGEIARISHTDGYLQEMHGKDGSTFSPEALYTRVPFAQHSDIPETLGCTLSDKGYSVIVSVPKNHRTRNIRRRGQRYSHAVGERGHCGGQHGRSTGQQRAN